MIFMFTKNLANAVNRKHSKIFLCDVLMLLCAEHECGYFVMRIFIHYRLSTELLAIFFVCVCVCRSSLRLSPFFSLFINSQSTIYINDSYCSTSLINEQMNKEYFICSICACSNTICYEDAVIQCVILFSESLIKAFSSPFFFSSSSMSV